MKKIEWVKNFGTRIDVLTAHALADGQRFIKKAYGFPNCLDYKYVDGEEFRNQKYHEELEKILKGDIIGKVDKVVSTLNKVCDDFEEFCRRKKICRGNQEYFEEYMSFYKIYSYFLGICDTPVFLEEVVSEAIYEDLKKKKAGNIEENLRIVTSYLKGSYIAEEEKELLKIASRANFYGMDSVGNSINEHAKKYSWTGYLIFNGKSHSKKYFADRIFKNIRHAEEKLKKMIEKQRETKSNYLKIAKKYNLNLKLLECAQKIIWIRDKRIASITRGDANEREFLAELAKKIKLKFVDIIHLVPEEVEKILIKREKIHRNTIRERQRGFAVQLLNGKLGKIITGNELRRLKKGKVLSVKELKGSVAFPGKVKGKVRVVVRYEDFSKFKKGEILVTNMTTPDYFPLMKKSAAIVTDIGGITSHAAIVSRELAIPCIIGTKIATKVLRDGDLVEVDADKGVVNFEEKVTAGLDKSL